MTVLSLSCFGNGPVPGLGFGGFGFLLSLVVGFSDGVGGLRYILSIGVSWWGAISGIGFWVLFVCSLPGVLCSLLGVLFMLVLVWLCV